MLFAYAFASIKDVQDTGETFSPLKKNNQHFKTWNFFLFLWFIFALLDPDPDPPTWLNPDPIWIRIRKHWQMLR